jgi:hypothetical protein
MYLMRVGAHAISKLNVAPVPERMNPTRTSFIALANLAPLSYFSYMTGTRSMKRDRNMPAIVTNSVKPDRPAAIVVECQTALNGHVRGDNEV